MVTHDPLAASFSERVIMLKDGQVFTEIYQGEDDKNVFHKEILRAQSILGGMMYEFSQIIWKNFQQNIIHYAIYIFSLVLSIVLFLVL